MQKHSQLEHFAPVQLLAQHREVAVTRGVDELDGMLRAPDNDAVALLKVALQLPVEVKPGIDRALQGDFDHGAVADHDGPVGQREVRPPPGLQLLRDVAPEAALERSALAANAFASIHSGLCDRRSYGTRVSAGFYRSHR